MLPTFEPPPFPTTTQQVIQSLAERDARKARVLGKYFFEMQQVLGEMHRVLRPGAAAVIVIGTSTMRGMNVQTHLCLAELAEEVGFDLVRIVERGIDRDRRMMPARWGAKTTQIEQRMHHEYVIGLLKPEEMRLSLRASGTYCGYPERGEREPARDVGNTHHRTAAARYYRPAL